jgi:hypothetical protein
MSRSAALGAFTVLAVLALSGAAAQAVPRPGVLSVRVTGLPVGVAAVGVLSGPGVRRRVAGVALTVRRARAGRYTLTLDRVLVARAVGPVRRGAARGRIRCGACRYAETRSSGDADRWL